MNESEKNAAGESGQGEKKAKRHRRGTRGGAKARAARSSSASSRSSAASETPSAGSTGRAKTTRTRKPRTTKSKAEAAAAEAPAAPAPEAPARETRRAEPARQEQPTRQEPREVPPAAPAAAEPPTPPARPAEPAVSSAPPAPSNEAPSQPATGTPIRPLGGYRAPVSRANSGRMSFGGRGGGRHHFRPSGFARPAVPPTGPDAGNAAPQQPGDETSREDLAQQQPQMPEGTGNGPAGRVPPQQPGVSPTAPQADHGHGFDEPEGPEPGNELNPPPGRQQNFGGRQQPGFRGPNRIGDRNQGRFGKFPQQQRGGPRNQGGQGGQPGFNQQGQPRGNQPPRQNWNQQQPRGQHRNQGGQQRGGNQFNGNRQQGGQPRFDRGPRQPHQQGMYPQQPLPGEEQQPNSPLPPQQNVAPQNVAPQFTPVPQPRPQTEAPSFGRELESDTRPLGAPAVPSPVVNEGAVPTLGAAETQESTTTPATGEHAGNGVDNSALAPFAEDIEIEETPTHPEKRREPTGRDMIINVVEGEEVRIAIVRKGVLEEFYMERASNESHVGNIYKGRVTNVEPSIQAAFVDFGLGKNGFLHISDLHPMYFGPQYRQKFQRVMEKREAERKRQQAQRPANTNTTEAFARGDAPVDGAATPPGVPESHLSSDATSAPVLEANESATLGATPADADIDAELNAEAPPEVLFDSDDDDKGHTEESAAPEQPAAQSADVATEQPVTPSASTGETVAMSSAASDAPASFPETETPAAESATPAATDQSAESSADSSSEDDDEDLDEFDIDDGGIAPMERVGKKTPRRDRPPIQQCLRRGQEVIVQVTKEGIGTKGPTLTTYVSIPGRALVMMPGMSALGVSRKIEDEGQRRSLRRILSDLNPPRNLGFIIRTAGAELTKGDLQGDLNYLVRMWKVIAQRIRNNKAPIELYQESDLVIRTMRDGFTNEIDRIIVDNEQVASRIRDFLSIVDPRSAGAVELYTGTLPIFQRYNIERQIENIHSRRVELPNGGSLVIDSAEALVAIDVNSGRYREQRDAEMTAFNMNKEAVKEIVRQLRLRDLGGVIVMDFIDMREERHKREIEHMLREHMKHDRAKAKVLRMSQFCMIEMTRQRVRPSIKRSIYMDCPHCRGTALIKTPESVSLDVMRRLAAGATRADVHRLDVRLYPTVANYLLNRKRKSLVELEEKTGKRINISADPLIAGDAVQIDGYNGRDDRINLQL